MNAVKKNIGTILKVILGVGTLVFLALVFTLLIGPKRLSNEDSFEPLESTAQPSEEYKAAPVSPPPTTAISETDSDVGQKGKVDQALDEENIIKAVTQLPTQRGFPMGEQSIASPESSFPPDRYFQIDQVRVDKTGEWATVTVVPKHRKSGKIVPTQPTFLLAHKVSDSWVPALPDMPEFRMWLEQVPSSFISEEEKSNIKFILNLR